jgi:hypothetical protein
LFDFYVFFFLFFPACDEDTQFECSDGSCISLEDKCNGSEDCEGGEDEENCGKCRNCELVPLTGIKCCSKR